MWIFSLFPIQTAHLSIRAFSEHGNKNEMSLVYNAVPNVMIILIIVNDATLFYDILLMVMVMVCVTLWRWWQSGSWRYGNEDRDGDGWTVVTFVQLGGPCWQGSIRGKSQASAFRDQLRLWLFARLAALRGLTASIVICALVATLRILPSLEHWVLFGAYAVD